MKTTFNSHQTPAQRAKSALDEHQRNRDPAAPIDGKPTLRLLSGGADMKGKLPDWSHSAHIQISDEGRALVSRMAQQAEEQLEDQFGPGASEAALAQLVAEGIEEGFLD